MASKKAERHKVPNEEAAAETRSVPAVNLSNEEFVLAWTKAKDVGEFCQATGIKKEAAFARSYQMRKKGVDLKKMSGRDKIDVTALNKLIKGDTPSTLPVVDNP